jgi:hypothetical protein
MQKIISKRYNMDAEMLERARQMAAQAAPGGQDILPKDTAAAAPQTQNPAERPGRSRAERQRVPMSVPVQKLHVPEIPGYHLHWFRGLPDRILRAQQAGYEFVEHDEVTLNNVDLGGESAASGNTNMGSRVSVVTGDEIGRDNQPVQLILMKLREELWRQDQEAVADRNENVAAALRGGRVGAGMAGGEGPGDIATRYVKQASNLFTRKR